MPATVRLDEIVDALEMQFDESSSFLDLDTGQVETFSSDLLRDAEESGDEEPDLPAWQKEEWEMARRVVSGGRFRELPTKFDVHEWEIMQEFSRSVESGSIREDLLGAIHAAGHSGISRTPFSGTASNRRGLHSAPRPSGRLQSIGVKKMTSAGSKRETRGRIEILENKVYTKHT